ncbi:MAG: hypothetical protein JWN02_2323, partial [Acidobacteria bacterium]|nr:hypothetical protein [Acidobacteriota bacterium]
LSTAAIKQGTITAGGKPVAGATVIWQGSSEIVATTDAGGHYSMPDPDRWAARVLVIHPDYALLDDGNRLDNKKKGLDRALEAGATISGRVVSADGQTPAPKAAVYVDGWPLTTSAADGTFSVAHAVKKWETVEVRTGDRVGVRARGTAPLTVKLAQAASLTGSVRDAKSRPLAGVDVQLSEGGLRFASVPRYSAISDAKGNYAVVGVRPGTYQLNARHPGYAITGSPVSLSAGQKQQKSFSGTEYARISGSVVDEDKHGVAAASVSVRAVSRDPMTFIMRGGQGGAFDALSAPDGRFVVRTAGETDLQVHGTKKGWPPAKTSSFRVTAGERKGNVILTIPRGLMVTGTVLDRGGKPLSGVTVVSTEAEGGMGGMRRFTMNFGGRNAADEDDQVRTGSDGKFSLRLKEGTYDLGFKREGYAAKAVRAHHVTADAKPVEVTLDPGVEITGRVVRGGAGVEGINVASVSSDNQAFTTTGPDGSFTLPDLTPGSMMVNFSKMDDYIQEMRTLSAPARDVVITLPAGGKISGHVIDKASHQPVTSFQAGISPSRSGGGMVIQMPPMLRTFTSDDGSFTMENVPPGSIQLVADAPGYTTGRVSGLNLEEGKSLSDVEIALETGVRLVGHVTGPDGAPVSGATVRPDGGPRAMRIAGLPGETVGVTDAAGEYSIESLEPGQKTFQVTHPNYVGTSKSVELSGRETRMDVQLTSGQRITGVVVTEGGAPVAEAQVFASSAGGVGGRSAQSDANGAFQFDSLPAGHYTFNASKQGYAEGIVRDFDVSSGAQVRVTLKTGGTIYGHVNGLTDADLAHTSVSARGANGNSNASVDAGGNYRLEGAPTGTVRVVAEMMTGFTDRRSSEAKSVQIDAGSSMQVDLEFRNDTTITGRVTRNGQPLGNAMVSFGPRNTTAQTSAQATADDSGNYKVAGLADGMYSVTVMDMARLTPHTDSYEVRGSGRFDIDIKASTLRGRVSDAGSNGPISEARISLRPTASGGGAVVMMGSRATVTDPNGNFVLDNVSAGSYTVTAEKENYGNDVRDVTVGDSTPELDMRLSANDALTLDIVDARDQHLLNAMVVVYDNAGRVVNDGTDGLMRFGGAPQAVNLQLSPGQYRAVVFAMGYATSSVTITAPGKQSVGLTPGGTIVVQSKATERRQGRLVDGSGQPYPRSPFSRDGSFGLEASPGATTIQNVAPGTYTLQVLDKGAVVSQTTVTVIEGQTAQTQI